MEQGLRPLLPLVDPPSSAPRWHPWAMFYRGWVYTHRNQLEQGLTALRASFVGPSARVTQVPYRKICLAETLLCAGHAEEGLAVVEETLAQVESTEERWNEAEPWRIKGELLAERTRRPGDGETRRPRDGETPCKAQGRLQREGEEEAEACFRRAIEVARGQEAKSWELRATTSLARLLRDQGRRDEARETLAAIYNWFSEGFDTPDLMDARALLDELA